MSEFKVKASIKISVVFSFVAMIAINILANTLPINHQTTAQVADSYPNLFAPAGYTFTIWALIYLLLAAYTLYQLGLFGKATGPAEAQLLNKVGLYFTISALANIAWIFSWHYNRIASSLLMMAVILISLIVINTTINRRALARKDWFFIQLPFTVYFGWITVAAIANVTVYLVSINWGGFGISEPVWTMIILLVGAAIGLFTMLKLKCVAYGLVLIWAYSGILVKHLSPSGFDGQYPAVITTAVICLVLFGIAVAYLFLVKKRKPL
jgi:hypothetical protein